MPVLFIGHGSPMNAIGENRYSTKWREIAHDIPKPKSILSISAHWMTPGDGARVSTQADPRQIYDFEGYPEELYNFSYAAKGDPALAERVMKLIPGAREDVSWGIDHGTWGVLAHFYPEADVPVVQLSLDLKKSFTWHYEVARRLAPLRDEGVLVMGSGNIVHNLRAAGYDEFPEPYSWAIEADWAIATAIRDDRLSMVVDLAGHVPDVAKLAVPTPDHYLPLVYALALKRDDDSVTFPVEGIAMGSISMRSLRIG